MGEASGVQKANVAVNSGCDFTNQKEESSKPKQDFVEFSKTSWEQQKK